MCNATAKSSNKRKRTAQREADSEKSGLGDQLVGSKVKVWWPLDETFYEGVVDAYDQIENKHRILYDDGEEELLNLNEEQWEPVGDDISPGGGQETNVLKHDASSKRLKKREMNTKSRTFSKASSSLERLKNQETDKVFDPDMEICFALKGLAPWKWAKASPIASEPKLIKSCVSSSLKRFKTKKMKSEFKQEFEICIGLKALSPSKRAIASAIESEPKLIKSGVSSSLERANVSAIESEPKLIKSGVSSSFERFKKQKTKSEFKQDFEICLGLKAVSPSKRANASGSESKVVDVSMRHSPQVIMTTSKGNEESLGFNRPIGEYFKNLVPMKNEGEKGISCNDVESVQYQSLAHYLDDWVTKNRVSGGEYDGTTSNEPIIDVPKESDDAGACIETTHDEEEGEGEDNEIGDGIDGANTDWLIVAEKQVVITRRKTVIEDGPGFTNLA